MRRAVQAGRSRVRLWSVLTVSVKSKAFVDFPVDVGEPVACGELVRYADVCAGNSTFRWFCSSCRFATLYEEVERACQARKDKVLWSG